MIELEFLICKYNDDSEIVYLKSFYALSIAKIESRLNDLNKTYNSLNLTDNSLSETQLTKKLSDNPYYLDVIKEKVKRKIKTMSEITFKYIELLYLLEKNLFVEIPWLEYSIVDRCLFLVHETDRFPQDTEKINEIYKAICGHELFEEEIEIEIDQQVVSGISLSSSKKIECKKIMSEIYSRRQKSVHMDVANPPDNEKLKIQEKVLSLIIEKLDADVHTMSS